MASLLRPLCVRMCLRACVCACVRVCLACMCVQRCRIVVLITMHRKRCWVLGAPCVAHACVRACGCISIGILQAPSGERPCLSGHTQHGGLCTSPLHALTSPPLQTAEPETRTYTHTHTTPPPLISAYSLFGGSLPSVLCCIVQRGDFGNTSRLMIQI